MLTPESLTGTFRGWSSSALTMLVSSSGISVWLLFGVSIIIWSATISVLYRFTPSSSSHELDWRRHSTYILFHFRIYFSTISASFHHITILWNSAMSCFFPSASFHVRFVAMLKFATVRDSPIFLTTGSAVTFPINWTLFKEFIYIKWKNKKSACALTSLDGTERSQQTKLFEGFDLKVHIADILHCQTSINIENVFIRP